MDKIDSMQEQMDNVSNEMAILRIKQKCCDQKHWNKKMKNVFEGLIRNLNMTRKDI